MTKRTPSRLIGGGVRLIAGLALLLAVISAVPRMVSLAQDTFVPSTVSSVFAKRTANGSVVSIAADGPLRRAQNWHDSDGYHLVFPNAAPAASLRAASGVRVRRIGTSLEVLVQTRPGSKVTVHPAGNQVDLIIDGNLEPRSLDGDSRYEPNYSSAQDSQQSNQPRLDSTSSSSAVSAGETAHTAGNWSPPNGPMSDLPPEPFPAETGIPEPAESPIVVQEEDEGMGASIFSGTTVFVVMILGFFGLIVSRKLRSKQPIVHTAEIKVDDELEWDDLASANLPEVRGSHKGDPGSSLVKSGSLVSTNGASKQSVVRAPVAGPTSLYGAYRIDQEVGKLILGQPHRMDVLASRAIDDRRAIETSLIKGVNALDLDESARRRARGALEEYGFVARQCAALLLSPDPFDRTSAARCLGEIRSEAALPFLLESLYDSETIVRNQAVLSIGELKLPSAIGALLDIARTHPDVPSALLSRTLSACSVEGLDFFDAVIPESSQLSMGHDLSMIEQITHLEPSSSVEELPLTCDDEQLAQALLALQSVDVQERSEALKTLAQFRVQSAVNAVASVARQDNEPNIRSIAIASLGLIDHESVFPAILIGMADDTREVRAAAARALSRLSFDRADAYVRVIETSDEQTLRDVAQACIQAGIVSQNLDRLGSSDRRQAYETFSLICLLAKANMNEPVLNTIADHSNLNVSLRAIHLLASTGQPGTFEQMRQLAAREGLDEEIKLTLLETLYKLDQTKPSDENVAELTAADSETKSVAPELETVADDSSLGILADFEPLSRAEINSEAEVGVKFKLDES